MTSAIDDSKGFGRVRGRLPLLATAVPLALSRSLAPRAALAPAVEACAPQAYARRLAARIREGSRPIMVVFEQFLQSLFKINGSNADIYCLCLANQSAQSLCWLSYGHKLRMRLERDPKSLLAARAWIDTNDRDKS